MATRIDPFREIERVFQEATRTAGSTVFPIDVYRQGEQFVVKVDLPGVDAETIDVDVEDRTLTIRAERKRPEGGEDFEWLTSERSFGTYARQLTLGPTLAVDRIEADYADGVLTLTIPVAEEAKPRKIQVTASKAPRVIEADGERDD
ncbi:Hsp20/alpha crystallin family protein [Gulosibacter sp. 10]|uniref:Hsp20/alpha crystallin family protein n=1 Tax=Gulosibacter sp. 10 TaxID=1255570 RepID=UPI00097F2B80|nr:Hsp20/alpha crystallin family protein [Gulosibacter sp. 10]SJM59399.1 18 kDa antigen 2 [Gulosibacter sp. 10]